MFDFVRHRLLPIWRLSERQLALVPVVVVLGLTAAALEGLGIGLVIPLLAVVTGTQTIGGSGVATWLRNFAGTMEPSARIAIIALVMFALILLKNLLAALNAALTAHICGQAGHRIRTALAQRLLTADYPFIRDQEPGALMNVFSNESWRAADAVNATLTVLVNACAAVILYGFLLALSWRLALIITVALAFMLLVHGALAKRLRAPSRRVSAESGKLTARMLDIIHAAQLIRLFHSESREQSRFTAASDTLRAGVLRLQVRSAMLVPLSEILFAGVFLVIVVLAWRWGFSFPLVATFMVLLHRLQPYVRNLQASWGQLWGWSGALESVARLLDVTGKPSAPTGSVTQAPLTRAIAFDRVTFSYDSMARTAEVLREASFEIPARQATGFIGRSGAGKTTIVQLLTRLVEPGDGKILVDDIPLSDIDPASWRARIAVASQDLELVSATVFENISYGMPDASPSAVERAARLAEAHDFIAALPQGYDTVIGAGGTRLSAGQRQRIALARAILCEPEVLVLDEATNAVDGVSETAILETIKARSGRSTTLLISHHHRTISVCDRVVVLTDGRVAAQASWASVQHLPMEELYEMGSGA
ncbi:MAG: ABC transporter ATP-binding protein [Gemmatimonadaceae bacterium]|nr:ABC transporter ATP-binding protein [Gemmatimonadaceae bacterium]